MHSLTCHNCGAPVTADARARVAQCDHCGSQVTNPRADDRGGLDEDLQQVEQWWLRERERYVTRDRYGNLHLPEEHSVLLVTAIAIGGVLALVSVAVGHKLEWDWLGIAGFFLFPVLISLPAALSNGRREARYKAYKALEAEYLGRRKAIIEWYQRA